MGIFDGPSPDRIAYDATADVLQPGLLQILDCGVVTIRQRGGDVFCQFSPS
jgi:hypothetical protein